MTLKKSEVRLVGSTAGVGVRILVPYDDVFGDGVRYLVIEPGPTQQWHRAMAIAHAVRKAPDAKAPVFFDDPTPHDILGDWEKALRLVNHDSESYEQSKAAWIAKAGSSHLRLGFARGYSMQEEYLRERLEVEFPGRHVVVDPRAELGRPIDSPTTVSLDVLICVESELDLKGVQYDSAEIVDLLVPLWAGPSRIGLAVVVRGWLGRHDVWIPA